MIDIDPHEYHGLILDLPAEEIPRRLAQELRRVGRIDLWAFQAFVHHRHLGIADGSDEEVAEMQVAERWMETLASRFPAGDFVVVVEPLELLTWYQGTSDCPRETDEDWEHFEVRLHNQTEEYNRLVRAIRKDQNEYEERKRIAAYLAAKSKTRSGRMGICEVCGSEAGFTEPEMSAIHPGMRFIRCRSCDARLVHSTRTVRMVVGPQVTEP